MATELQKEVTIYGCISSTTKLQNGYKRTLFDNLVTGHSQGPTQEIRSSLTYDL